MKPELRLEGGSLVLYDAYTASQDITAGDALKVTGEWRVAPTAEGDRSIGVAHASANIGQPVAVVVLGLARGMTAADMQRGDAVCPASERGRGRRAEPAQDLLAGRGRPYGVAVESKAAGKAVWIHLQGG